MTGFLPDDIREGCGEDGAPGDEPTRQVGRSWGARLFLARTFTLSGAILVSLTLLGSGLTRRDLFLCKGDLAAPAGPIPFLGLRKPIPWSWLVRPLSSCSPWRLRRIST